MFSKQTAQRNQQMQRVLSYLNSDRSLFEYDGPLSCQLTYYALCNISDIFEDRKYPDCEQITHVYVSCVM